MSNAIVRDDVVPAVIFDPNIGSYQSVHAGKVFAADDPFVRDHPELFDDPIERATAAPGEKRNTRRTKNA